MDRRGEDRGREGMREEGMGGCERGREWRGDRGREWIRGEGMG